MVSRRPFKVVVPFELKTDYQYVIFLSLSQNSNFCKQEDSARYLLKACPVVGIVLDSSYFGSRRLATTQHPFAVQAGNLQLSFESLQSQD